jgi:hypothetical protein
LRLHKLSSPAISISGPSGRDGSFATSWRRRGRFTGLLKAGIFDQALFENAMPDEEELGRRATDAAAAMQVLLSSGRY